MPASTADNIEQGKRNVSKRSVKCMSLTRHEEVGKELPSGRIEEVTSEAAMTGLLCKCIRKGRKAKDAAAGQN